MKKIAIIILLSCMAVHSNMVSMQQKQETVKQNNHNEFGKIDKLKLAAAVTGFAWCSTVAGIACMPTNTNFPECLAYIYNPISVPVDSIAKLLGYELHIGRVTKITGVISGIMIGSLGCYIYKKLSQLKQSSKPKK